MIAYDRRSNDWLETRIEELEARVEVELDLRKAAYARIEELEDDNEALRDSLYAWKLDFEALGRELRKAERVVEAARRLHDNPKQGGIPQLWRNLDQALADYDKEGV